MGKSVLDCLAILLLIIVKLEPNICEEDSQSLVILQVVFRHGNRTPLYTYPNDPYHNFTWPEGFGHLTHAGQVSSYELGQRLRKKYDKFLGPFNLQEVYVRSTDMDRTLMSAQCVLAGLYPPDDHQEDTIRLPLPWQPIPVHTVPFDSDWLSPDSYCPRSAEVEDKAPEAPIAQKLDKEYAQLYTNLTEFMGLNVTDLRRMVSVHDILYAESNYKLNLPEWTGTVYPEPANTLAAKGVCARYYTDLSKRLRAGPLLKNLVYNWKKATCSKTGPKKKIFLYSGHDKNIMSSLMVMDVFDPIYPPFSAALIFELHHKNDTGYTIQVRYWNDSHHEPHELKLPKCNMSCPLDQFIDIVSPFIPDDWESECNMDSGVSGSIRMPGKDVAIIVLSVLLCFVLSLVGYRYCRKRKTFKLVANHENNETDT